MGKKRGWMVFRVWQLREWWHKDPPCYAKYAASGPVHAVIVMRIRMHAR
jgi:hypothetical protein